MESESIFRCKCKEPKTNQIIFDGGSAGTYGVELCPQCYAKQDKKFLLSEKRISNL